MLTAPAVIWYTDESTAHGPHGRKSKCRTALPRDATKFDRRLTEFFKTIARRIFGGMILNRPDGTAKWLIGTAVPAMKVSYLMPRATREHWPYKTYFTADIPITADLGGAERGPRIFPSWRQSQGYQTM